MVPDHCWRCETEVGTLLHVWWSCPRIQPYWRKIHEVISSLPLEFLPGQYLLHLSKIPSKKYFKSIAMHLINVARLCMPVYWRSAWLSSLKEWALHFDRIATMEELILTSQDKFSSFSAIWEAWITYKPYQELLQHNI